MAGGGGFDVYVIGIDTIVIKDIPDNSVVVAVLAKVIETIDKYKAKCIIKCDYTKDLFRDDKKKYLIDKFKTGVDNES